MLCRPAKSLSCETPMRNFNSVLAYMLILACFFCLSMRSRRLMKIPALHYCRDENSHLIEHYQADALKCVFTQFCFVMNRFKVYETPRMFLLRDSINYQPSKTCCGRRVRDNLLQNLLKTTEPGPAVPPDCGVFF